MQDPDSLDREGGIIFHKDAKGNISSYLFHIRSRHRHGQYRPTIILTWGPKGRDEGKKGPSWVRRRDEYGDWPQIAT